MNELFWTKEFRIGSRVMFKGTENDDPALIPPRGIIGTIAQRESSPRPLADTPSSSRLARWDVKVMWDWDFCRNTEWVRRQEGIWYHHSVLQPACSGEF